jgi:hypothetical protein
MSKIYSIETTQDLNVRDYILFESHDQINNQSSTPYLGILKILKEIFKQVDISKIIGDK